MVRIVMATGSPIMNGDVPHAANPPGTLEETLQLMNNLIQENRDLKGENPSSLSFRQTFQTCRKDHHHFFIIHLCCVRSPPSDQPVNEGTFRGPECLAAEAAGGAQLPGEQAGRCSQAHRGADLPKPGAEPEVGQGRERGGRRLDGEAPPRPPWFLLLHLVPKHTKVDKYRVQWLVMCYYFEGGSSDQSGRRTWCTARSVGSTAGGEEWLGGHELRAAAEGGPGLPGGLLHRGHQGLGKDQHLKHNKASWPQWF